MLKYIFALIGYFFGGKNFLAAILGFFIGSFVDGIISNKKRVGTSNHSQTNPFDDYQRRQTVVNDYANMLMILSAAVIRADGKVVVSELNYIKAFFNQQFGNVFSAAHLQTLKHYAEGNAIPLQQVCMDIKMRTPVEVRIQLLHYLFGAANADGEIVAAEMQVIQKIAQYLAIPAADFESIRNMFYHDANSDYKVLGIESSASVDEIKKAYRQMAIRYHPDKVAYMGEEYQKGAQEKFQKIQEAFDSIKKLRGFN